MQIDFFLQIRLATTMSILVELGSLIQETCRSAYDKCFPFLNHRSYVGYVRERDFRITKGGLFIQVLPTPNIQWWLFQQRAVTAEIIARYLLLAKERFVSHAVPVAKKH